jgi:cytochrome c553
MAKRVNVYKEMAARYDFEATLLLRRVLELEGKTGDKDRMDEILTELADAYLADIAAHAAKTVAA